MKLKKLYNIYCNHPEITTDSRKIIKNSLFFALKGEQFNGEDYAEDALKKGAAYAIVSNDCKITDGKIIHVENTLKTLQDIASFHRKKTSINILAITGSNGKTTTKELCKAVLEKKYKVAATQGNLNNHIGVPLTLLSFSKQIEFGIVEMGANHPKEIKALSEIALPDYGLITNIGKAHLEGFGSIEGVTKAKGELYDILIKNKNTLFINVKDNHLKTLIPDNYENKILYNNDKYQFEIISSDPYLNLRLILDKKEFEIKTNLVGKYNAENVLAAVVVGNYFQISTDKIKEAIESYIPYNNRSQLITTDNNKIILDAYNANPSSMKNAIENFAEMKGKKKICILGQMLELGLSSHEEHKILITDLKNRNFNKVFLVGEEFINAELSSDFNYFSKVEDLIADVKKSPLKSSFIIIKGSRGNQLEKVLPYL